MGGKVRTLWGRWGRRLTGEHLQYHPTADLWLPARAPLPTPRRSTRLAEVYGRLFAVGGEAALGWLADVACYDPASDGWVSGTPLHEAIDSPGVAAVEGNLYVTGAACRGGVLVEACQVALKLFVHQRHEGHDGSEGNT